MRFMVTIEQSVKDEHTGEFHWQQMLREQIVISAAELAARQVQKIVQSQGLEINESKIRQILFEELDEGKE